MAEKYFVTLSLNKLGTKEFLYDLIHQISLIILIQSLKVFWIFIKVKHHFFM